MEFIDQSEVDKMEIVEQNVAQEQVDLITEPLDSLDDSQQSTKLDADPSLNDNEEELNTLGKIAVAREKMFLGTYTEGSSLNQDLPMSEDEQLPIPEDEQKEECDEKRRKVRHSPNW